MIITLEEKVTGIASYLSGFTVEDAGHSGWWILKGKDLSFSVRGEFGSRLLFRLISYENKVGNLYFMDEVPSITVRGNRSDKAIAGDIARRLLPVSRSYAESLTAWKNEKLAILNRQSKMGEMLKQIGGGSDLWQRYSAGTIKVGIPWGWSATIDEQGKVKIECEVDFETSCEIIEIIKKG